MVKAQADENPKRVEITRPEREAEKPQLSKVEFVKVEKNLASLGFFTPSSKRVKNEKGKTITFVKVIDGKRVEATATIAPAALFGLPITADQDKYLALQKLLNDIQQREGKVENPVGFSSSELLRLLQHTDAGGRYVEIAEWLKVMTLTGIISEGTVYFAGKKQWVSDTFHVFDRAISAGKEMPDGSTADRNYVWLSNWQLENINNNHLLPIDLETYRELKNHIAKALVPLLQIWLYASRDNGAYSKRYDELCQILNLGQFKHLSRVKQQLGPSLNELQAHGYLASWIIEKTKDQKALKIVFRHGEKFHRDRRQRMGTGESGAPTALDILEPENTSAAAAADDERLVGLVARGVTKKQAHKTLAAVSADQPVLDQLEWGDSVIAGDPQKIQNPAGFYVSLIRDNVAVPANFETSAKSVERSRRAEEHSAARQERARLENEFRTYQEQEVEGHLSALPAEELERLVTAAKAELIEEHKNLRGMISEEQLQRLARAGLATKLTKQLPRMTFSTFRKSRKVPSRIGQ